VAAEAQQQQTKPNSEKPVVPARSLKIYEVSDADIKKIDINYNVRFLSPGFEEIEAAACFLRNKFPHISEDVLHECLTDRINTTGFNKGTIVYVIARKTIGRKRLTDAQSFRENEDGVRITIHPGPEKLAEEEGLFGPVCAKDHWSESENGWVRELNRSSFLAELGKIAAPWSINQPDAPGHKTDLPNWIILQSC
jgi:hypothetical protein